MSLQPQAIPPIPEETARVARALFPKGNRYMQLRDELGAVYTDEQFAALYPQAGQFAEQPWRIALLLVMQYMENYVELKRKENPDAARCDCNAGGGGPGHLVHGHLVTWPA